MPRAKSAASKVPTESLAEKPKKPVLKVPAEVTIDRPKLAGQTKTVAIDSTELAQKVAAKAPRKPKAAKSVVEQPPKRTTADFLKEALAAKKAGIGIGQVRLRPDMGNAKASKDAERRFGKSRKVH